jgi:hypothetical protein
MSAARPKSRSRHPKSASAARVTAQKVHSSTWGWWWPKLITLAIGLAFVRSRWHLWIDRPMDFSEIIYSYMPYAHLWASGVKPYLEQWYEYPPATIPLFYVPHVIDMTTRWWKIHVDYLHAYRGLILLIDIAGFGLLWAWLHRVQRNVVSLVLSLGYFIAVTSLANHFIYDSMDWAFTVSLLLAAVAPTLWPRPATTRLPSWLPNGGQVAGWLGYFIATCLKLINAPLGLPLAITELPTWPTIGHWLSSNSARAKWWHAWRWPLFRTTLAIGLTGALVWGAPLFLYRSSLQVMLVYHQQRGLQVDTPAAIIVRTLNESVHSEKIVELYKNYEVTGPISQQALSILSWLFPVALLAFSLGTSYWLGQLPDEQARNQARIWVTLGYVLVFLLVGKVLSRPFLLWPLPFIAALPLRSWKEQLWFMIPSFLMVWVSYVPVSNDAWFGLPLPIWVGWARTVLLLVLIWQWWVHRHQAANTSQS